MTKRQAVTKYKRDPRKKYYALRQALRQKLLATCENCAICGRPLDKTRPAGDPLAPEVDEIIPVSRGGSPYDLDNLQLVHKICNLRKGAKMPGDQVKAGGNPIPTSRTW